MSASPLAVPLGPSGDEEAPRCIGHYALYGEIASGGMATVHFGRILGAAGFSRTVAIKRLHAQFARDRNFVSMFLDEARLAGRIRHPNVVPIHEVVTTEDELFLVMEYVAGESLSRAMKLSAELQRPMPVAIASSILSGALQGLHAAHEARDEQGQGLDIIHRDVSPHNILIGADGRPRVLDFGIAKASSRVYETMQEELKGKLAYMAPEQLEHEALTRQADIYAAGVVLWEACTGQRLFDGKFDQILRERLLGGRPRSILSIVPSLPSGLDDVVQKSLSRQPSDRFATAREMAIALERIVTPASPAEVSDWLDSLCGPTLHARAQRMAEIESKEAPPAEPRSGDGYRFGTDGESRAYEPGTEGPIPSSNHRRRMGGGPISGDTNSRRSRVSRLNLPGEVSVDAPALEVELSGEEDVASLRAAATSARWRHWVWAVVPAISIVGIVAGYLLRERPATAVGPSVVAPNENGAGLIAAAAASEPPPSVGGGLASAASATVGGGDSEAMARGGSTGSGGEVSVSPAKPTESARPGGSSAAGRKRAGKAVNGAAAAAPRTSAPSDARSPTLEDVLGGRD